MEEQDEFPEMFLKSSSTDRTPDHAIDITAELCPMTFVRTRLALDRLAPGQTLLVRLRGEEPRRNVPRTAVEQGHEVVGSQENADGTTVLLIRKGKEDR